MLERLKPFRYVALAVFALVSDTYAREFRPGSIVLTHFTPNFEKDVAAFVTRARTNGLTPALLTDCLR
ncbi:hypothetical protein LWC34_28920 [Kibdelosporangium philippinense]|uniref:Uncharacterized protein n=1 Tax=Kibdelosporangium philippinense TaxID=211113 RepID=A0ABS8ZIP9_9PSEU|nr:hypothetical protein [Kibdelosporangium philippinense]MCE7006820.1 hypothetical protein [Kibdelosporangium philippinense]